MAFLQLQDIRLAFGDRDVLRDISFALYSGQKVALAGANGSGKSTLLKVMAGLSEVDSGKVILPEGTRVAYLPQSGILLGSGTVYQEAEAAFDPWRRLETQMHELLESLDAHDERTASKLLHQHQELQERLLESGYYQRRETVEQTLKGLGFSDDEFDRPASTFSGGWQMRIALGRCLLEKPDLLLLDEPTNYLDLEAKDWLEAFLRAATGGFLLVSHDRGFLDAVVTEVAEIFRGQLTLTKGNFSNWEDRRRLEIQQMEEAWKQQQGEIAKQEDYINRFRAKATKAAGVQSRIKALEKLERVDLPESLVPMHFSFPPAPHSGKIVLEVQNLGKAYGERPVLRGLEYTFLRGEKIAVAGRNGMGKSTLMRILAGKDQSFDGMLRWGTDVQAAWFSQDHEKDLDPAKTVLEEVESEAPTAMIPRLRDLLGSFLFRGDDVFKKTAVLSGGEKNRLTLVKLLLHPANLLLLDEPTNHLDLASKDVLLEALRQFGGTVLVVSHDKYFLEHLVGKVLELTDGNHRLHLGGWQAYQEALAAEVPAERLRAVESAPSRSQIDRQDMKKREGLWRKLEREEKALLTELEALEGEKLKLEADLSTPEVYSQGELAKAVVLQLDANKLLREQIQDRWEVVALEMEEVRAQMRR